MDKRCSCANCSSTDHHVSACPTYKQGMKAIGFSHEDEDASEVDHEEFMRGVIAKFGPRCFFCNLEDHFKSDCPQFWDAVADIKHPRHEEALSGVKAIKARLLCEAEARRKDKPQELATKKMQAVTEKTGEPEPVTAADDFKIDYRAAARDALNRVQQELVTKEIEQKVKLELENEKLHEKLHTFEVAEVEETKAPISLSIKLKVISGQRFGKVPQGSKIDLIISTPGNSKSEWTIRVHFDAYADYLRQVEPRTESRAVRALLTTGWRGNQSPQDRPWRDDGARRSTHWTQLFYQNFIKGNWNLVDTSKIQIGKSILIGKTHTFELTVPLSLK